ncbi:MULTISPECIES: hypothetical protein [Rhizobium]|uniref:hypothetical protein n=1 Tax=Rhizobium TaxID=379 RepID=UPI001B3222EA|nr:MULTISPECIES: hypothetical protein [Rhizobium]MBX4911024.1 hypothetical protein [Rhizobium bangladeshense]MBX4949097.1 hypothetical protein [Rhizobium binae]MBX4964105.1 hypothetical protein [Rhizobium binae]MBX5254032.1 hypothetical protein [Rhizobium sp. NLR4b]MBX5260141.1 hypothetical protein [Rhizobium sp. NLR16b]
MASPWKLLARLVSPRRQQRQEQGSTDAVKSDVLAIAKPTANNELGAADRPADEKSVLQGHSAAVPVDPGHAEEAASAVDGPTDIDGAGPEEGADPALFDEVDIAAHAAGEGQTRKRSTRGKKSKTIAVVLPRPPSVSTASDDAINLNEEIRLLRHQLASKLRMQNAQLKHMLERFEH